MQFFMMKGLNQTAADVSAVMALLMLPWVIKPFYALICDFIPLWGYHRKSYLIVANVVAIFAFLTIAATTSLPIIMSGLLVMATAMAVSTTLMVALAVERGQKDGKARDYFSGQVFWYYTANILAAVLGGYLCQHMLPHVALHTAALIAMVPVFVMSLLTGFMLKEEKSKPSKKKLFLTWASLKLALKAPSMWLTAALFGTFHFNLSVGVPLYFFESKTLHFAQSAIGQLAACNAFGLLLGSVVYATVVKKLALKHQLALSVFLAAASTLSYLALTTPATGMAIELVRGVSTMTGLLTLYGLASDVCPKRTEASIMAIFLCARNVSTEAATFTGGQLFTNVFHNQYVPLIFTAFAFTASGALLLPYVVASVEKARARREANASRQSAAS